MSQIPETGLRLEYGAVGKRKPPVRIGMSQIPETGLRPVPYQRPYPDPPQAHRNEPDTGNGIETPALSALSPQADHLHRNEPDTGNGIETTPDTAETTGVLDYAIGMSQIPETGLRQWEPCLFILTPPSYQSE